MAQADWTEFGGSLSTGTVARGVTNGIPRPSGGGNFVYGFNSKAITPGAAALFCNLTSFAPMAKGGSVRGAVQRGLSGGVLNFAPFLIIGGQGNTVSDNAYMLGLEDNEPHRIMLVKGKISDGIPSAAPGAQGVLARSSASYVAGTWLHLRLDMIYNGTHDVMLQAFQSDLALHPVDAPSWVAIPGLTNFVDDHLGVNSGSAPYASGYVGFGFASRDTTRRGYFDHVEVQRQLL